jgi:hypothetical protein
LTGAATGAETGVDDCGVAVGSTETGDGRLQNPLYPDKQVLRVTLAV